MRQFHTHKIDKNTRSKSNNVGNEVEKQKVHIQSNVPTSWYSQFGKPLNQTS